MSAGRIERLYAPVDVHGTCARPTASPGPGRARHPLRLGDGRPDFRLRRVLVVRARCSERPHRAHGEGPWLVDRRAVSAAGSSPGAVRACSTAGGWVDAALRTAADGGDLGHAAACWPRDLRRDHREVATLARHGRPARSGTRAHSHAAQRGGRSTLVRRSPGPRARFAGRRSGHGNPGVHAARSLGGRALGLACRDADSQRRDSGELAPVPVARTRPATGPGLACRGRGGRRARPTHAGRQLRGVERTSPLARIEAPRVLDPGRDVRDLRCLELRHHAGPSRPLLR